MSPMVTTSEEGRRLGAGGLETRRRRADLKSALTAGTIHVADVLADPPPHAEAMPVVALLLACPRIYRMKARRALTAAGISELTTVNDLTERQYRALLAFFRNQHPSVWALWRHLADGGCS